MPKPICDAHENRSLWIEERRQGIGASEVPSILGIGRFGSPLSVAASKLGLGPPEDEESELMRWGRYVEGPMLAAFTDETKLPTKPIHTLYQYDGPGAFGFMLATPDGEVLENGEIGGVECKLKIFGGDEWERDGVPDEVQVQAQAQMFVMGWRFAYVLALLDGYRLRFRRIARSDERLGDEILPAAEDFWARLKEGRAQRIDIGNPEATKGALLRLFPADRPGLVRIEGPEALGHYNAWRLHSAAEKAAGTAKEHARNALAALMGEATDAVLDGGIRLTLRTQRRGPYAVTKEAVFKVLREKK
jgi:putative phage-type endonuclease